MNGEDRQVQKSTRVARGRRGIAQREEGRDVEKGGAEGVSLIHPKDIGRSRSPCSPSRPPIGQTTSKDVLHTPAVSSPLSTSVPALPYSDPFRPESTPRMSIAQPDLQHPHGSYAAPTSSSSKVRPTSIPFVPFVPSSCPIPQPQLKPPPRQASLYIRQVQTYTPTTTTILPPRSTSMYASPYSSLPQEDDSQKYQSGRMLHIVQEEDVPVMGRYKVSHTVDVGQAQAGLERQGLEVEVVPLDRDDSRCGVAL